MDQSNKSAVVAIVEVVTVFVIIRGIYWGVQWLPAFQDWQRIYFEGEIITVMTGAVFVPLLAMQFGRKSSLSVILYLRFKHLIITVGKALLVMLPVIILSFPVLQAIGYVPYEWLGALCITVLHFIAILFLCFLLKEEKDVKQSLFSKGDHVIIISGFIVGLILIFLTNFIHPKIARILYALVFIGMAEEFVYRGYMMRVLNSAFEKPFKLLGYSFGYSLIITSLLFGLAHVLNPANPWHWAWGFWTVFAGFAYGIIRDKGGSFLVSGLVHGSIMVFPVLFS